jgi:hypothetical protein
VRKKKAEQQNTNNQLPKVLSPADEIVNLDNGTSIEKVTMQWY